MAKEYAKKFYSSTRWIKCRNAYMKKQHYICERCGGMAYIVHHKTPITPSNINNFNITLDWNNLQALCLECHNFVHGTDCIRQGLTFDENGNVIKSPQE